MSVVMFLPLGMVKRKFCSWMVATSANARFCTSDVDAAESIKTVVNKFLGLAQLGLIMLMVLNKLSTALQDSFSTGSPCQAALGFQFLV